jgi:dynactin complex subunit
MNEENGPDETSATQVPLRRVTKNDEAILNTANWVDKSELCLEDKVSVADSRAVFLQGLGVYVGKVHFAEGAWDGIQLSGPSIGKSNCDGSYEGNKYFAHVGKNNGVMAPISKVNKRLNRKQVIAKLTCYNLNEILGRNCRFL